jgi:hypothetical protein
MSPKTKALCIALLTAVAGALAAWLQACTPSQLDKADRAFEQAQAHLACVREVEQAYADLALEPMAATPARAQEAFRALKACAKRETQADAGAE